MMYIFATYITHLLLLAGFRDVNTGSYVVLLIVISLTAIGYIAFFRRAGRLVRIPALFRGGNCAGLGGDLPGAKDGPAPGGRDCG